jgi:hypothetical protein
MTGMAIRWRQRFDNFQRALLVLERGVRLAQSRELSYGSRTLGRQRPASDIDLTLIGPAISSDALAQIEQVGQVLHRRGDGPG